MSNAANSLRVLRNVNGSYQWHQLRNLLASALCIAGNRFKGVIGLHFRATSVTVRATDGHVAWDACANISESNIMTTHWVSAADCKALVAALKGAKHEEDLPITIATDGESLSVVSDDRTWHLYALSDLAIPSIDEMARDAGTPGAVAFGCDLVLLSRCSMALRKLNGRPVAGFLVTPPSDELSPVLLSAQVPEVAIDVRALVMPMRI